MRVQLAFALVVAAAIAVWMATGDMIVAGSAQEAERRPPAERSQSNTAPFRVRAEVIEAQQRPRDLSMRGRTRADAIVNVAAETVGRVDERVVARGDRVAAGDILCRLDPGAREAELAKAEAERDRAALDYEAATQLRGRGFESETRVASTKASLDAASAAVAAAQEELSRATVRAPLAGTVEDPVAETGAMLTVGSVCATIVDTDPIVVTGQVTERDVSFVVPGTEATISLVTGERVRGKVSFVARTADPATRTFNVEIEVPNPDGALRDGVTAEADIPLPPVTAHRISPGVLTLGPDGGVGVRSVDEDGLVTFRPVTIVGQNEAGFWVTGLPERLTVITVGQDYVVDGQTVIAVTGDVESEG